MAATEVVVLALPVEVAVVVEQQVSSLVVAVVQVAVEYLE